MIEEKFVPPADAVVENNTQSSFVPPTDAIVEKVIPAPTQKANVEAPKFVAPTKVAPVNPKTIKPSTTAPFEKKKLIEDEAEVSITNLQRKQDIEREYNYKINSLRNQDVAMSKPLNVTFKLGDKTFSVKNPQMNVMSLNNERDRKIQQVEKREAQQRGKIVVGAKQQDLLDANNYYQVKANDELLKLKDDRKYYTDLNANPQSILANTEPIKFNIAGRPSLENHPIKPEILQDLKIQSTGNNDQDYLLVKKALAEKVSNIDADITNKTKKIGISKTDIKNVKNQTDYVANLYDFNQSDVVYSAARFNPEISKKEKQVTKQVGEVTSMAIPSAEIKKEEEPFFSKANALKLLANVTPIAGPAASLLSGFFNMSKEGFFKKMSYKDLNSEKGQLQVYDASNKTLQDVLDIRLEKSYDDITNTFGVPKEQVKQIAFSLLNTPNNQKIQAPIGMDQALFNGIVESPAFNKISNTYSNASKEFDVEGQKKRLSLGEASKVTAQKAKEFGTISKMQKDIEREQAYVDVLKKKSKDASVLSNDFYNNLAYETAYALTYGKATTQEMIGGAAKIGQTALEGIAKGEVSDLTKQNIDELISSTDLFDALVPTNSALKLGLFNTNKFITVKDQTGKNIALEIDDNNEIKNVHAEDFTYVVRDPKQVQEITNFYNQNKEELLNEAKTLSKTEGGKRAIFDNTFRNVGKEVIQEGPTMLFEIAAGAGIAPLVANSDKLRKITQYGVAATSNMLETYPMIYKGYQENIDDPNNPYAAMLTTGGLGAVSLFTSGLDRKLISLGENAVSKEILPEIIENAAPVIKAISKETAKIADKSLRDITFKSAVSKAMIQETMKAVKPAFRKALSKGGEMGVETLGEVAEETVTEPLTQFTTNFLNSAILNNQAYKQETLDDLGFLDPETAWLTFWTAGAISSGANVAQSMQKNNPYTNADYVKAALKKPDEVEKMLTNLEENNSPEVIQKIRNDYNTLQTSYETKKKDLNISQDLLESLDFTNPAVQIVMSQANINPQVIETIRGTKNYDALLIQQVLEEQKSKELESEIQDGVKQGLILETEDGYKAVGNNPLSKPYEKTIADFQKTNNNIQYFDNFITEFNNKTAPVQRQFVDELQKSLVMAPDLYDVKQENQDESSLYFNVNDFNTLRTNTLSKLVNEARLVEINNETSDNKSENKDVEKLQQEKQIVTQAIKDSTEAITLIQQQYKPGRTQTDEELKKTTETARLAQIELATALDAVSRLQDVDNLDLDNHEINDIYEKYSQTIKDRNQVVSKLKKDYKVDTQVQPEITPEKFSKIKQNITRKYNLGKSIESGKGNLADLTEFVDLSENLGVSNLNETLQKPESSEDIDNIVNNPQQLVMQAKEMNLSPLLSALNVKKRVATKLHAQLNEAEQEKTLGINEILSTKIDKTSGQNTTYIIDGKEYTIANRPNSNTTTISEEQKSQIVLDELGREVARRIFSESMDLNPNTVEAIMTKVMSESYPELTLELNQETLKLISANILKLKMELENQDFDVLFNDKVISSVFATPSETDNAIVGIASKVPLIAVSPEGNIHLINFKLFAGNTSDNLSAFDEDMTVIKSLFTDNNIAISGIHTLPIKVKTNLTDNTIQVEKNSLDFRETENPISPSLIQLQTDFVLENDILTTLGAKAVEEEVEITEETPIIEELKNTTPIIEEVSVTKEPKETVEIIEEKPLPSEVEGVEAETEAIEPISKSPVYNAGGTTNGVYITIVDKKLANGNTIYKIQIENNSDLNEYYKGKNFKSLSDVKDEYRKNAIYIINGKEVIKQAWFTPENIVTKKAYSLQDSEGNSIKSPEQVEVKEGWNNMINDLSFVSNGRGAEVTIEEEEGDFNDSENVQANFIRKANLVIKMNGDKIATVPLLSDIRQKLQTIKVDGKNRLAPTSAKINKVVQKDFDRIAPVVLGDWLLDFALNNGAYTYEIGYVQYDKDKETFILKNAEGKTIFIYSPEKQPTLGATYLIVEDASGKKTRFALETPKLKDVVLSDGSNITREEIIKLIQQVPTTFFQEKGKELYNNIANGLRVVITNSNDLRIKEFSNLVAKELGAKETPGRAQSTEEQLAILDSLPAYTFDTKKLIEDTIADFFLNRIITLSKESEGRHLITTNPATVFLDNTLEVNDLVSGNYSEEPTYPEELLKENKSITIETIQIEIPTEEITTIPDCA